MGGARARATPAAAPGSRSLVGFSAPREAGKKRRRACLSAVWLATMLGAFVRFVKGVRGSSRPPPSPPVVSYDSLFAERRTGNALPLQGYFSTSNLPAESPPLPLLRARVSLLSCFRPSLRVCVVLSLPREAGTRRRGTATLAGLPGRRAQVQSPAVPPSRRPVNLDSGLHLPDHPLLAGAKELAWGSRWVAGPCWRAGLGG